MANPPPSLGPEFPADMRDFIDKSLLKNPAERWSAEQLLGHPWLARHMHELGAARTCAFWPAELQMTPRQGTTLHEI